jgi:hypothetical protein
MVTSAPAAAKARAVASPMPALPPTMTTRCPSKDIVTPQLPVIAVSAKLTETLSLVKC